MNTEGQESIPNVDRTSGLTDIKNEVCIKEPSVVKAKVNKNNDGWKICRQYNFNRLDLNKFTESISSDGIFPTEINPVKIRCNDRHLYLFGLGLGIQGDLQVWRYNLFSRTWQRLSCVNIPKICVLSNYALLNNTTLKFYNSQKLYICHLNDSDVLYFDEICTTGEWPIEALCSPMAEQDGFYYFGLCLRSQDIKFYVYRLDLTTMVWKSLNHDTLQRKEGAVFDRVQIAIYSNKIYLFRQKSDNLSEIGVFNILEETWETLKIQPDETILEYPKPNSCLSLSWSSLTPSKIYVLIKNHKSAQCEKMFTGLWRINLETLTWSCVMSELRLPISVGPTHIAVTAMGKLFAFFMSYRTHKDGISSARSMFEAQMDNNFQGICWEWVSRYSLLGMPNFDSEKLVTILPSVFVDLIAPKVPMVLEKENIPAVLENEKVPAVLQNEKVPTVLEEEKVHVILEEKVSAVLENEKVHVVLEKEIPAVLENEIFPAVLENEKVPAVLGKE